MASKGQPDLPKMFTQLQLAGEDGDYEWGLEVIDEILKVSPDDLDALSCQLVCLIHTSDFDEALTLIDKLCKLTGNKDSYQYEKAYCYYKLERYKSSLEVLDKLSKQEKDSLRVLDLQSQVYYRLGNYHSSVEGFRRGTSMNDSNERTTNMAAALCYTEPSHDVLNSIPTVTMEQCFNVATVHTSVMKDYKTAKSLLQKAEKLCQESDSVDEEDIEADLVPIRIQLAYTLQLLGQLEESLSIYSSVLKSKPSPLHQLTAANNIIVINGDKDVFDSKKKIKLLLNESAVKKLNTRQLEIVLFNRCLFALRLNQLEQCRDVLKEMNTIGFKDTELITLAQSALFNRDKKANDSLSLLETYLSSHPSSSLVLYLTLAQLYWDNNQHNKAISVLENIPNVAQYLGVVSMLVSLRKSDQCSTLLNNVIKEWKESQLVDKRRLVLWEIAQYLLENNQPQLAANVLEWLYHNEDKNNVRYLAYLISAYSRFNTKKAEEMSHSLPSFTTPQSIDVNSLEQMPTFQATRRIKTILSTAAEPVKQEKKKKKRKKRLPKNFDPSKPIDPERWLPLRERSYYRKSKKKGQSYVGKGTQGMSASMAAMAAKLDASKPKSPDLSSEAATPSPRSATVKPQPKKQGQQSRKKKKGKR